MSLSAYDSGRLARIADALERIATALEKANEPSIVEGPERYHSITIKPEHSIDLKWDPKPTVHDHRSLPGDPSDWQGVAVGTYDAGPVSTADIMEPIPEHRLKSHVYENARDGGLLYDQLPPMQKQPAERRHTIPEGYKRIPKDENCPQMWTEADGARYCPHGPVDYRKVVLHHDLLSDRWVDANSGHSWRSAMYGKPGPHLA
jgi:hypothetical protein